MEALSSPDYCVRQTKEDIMAFNEIGLKKIDKIIGEPFRIRVPEEHKDKLRYEVDLHFKTPKMN